MSQHLRVYLTASERDDLRRFIRRGRSSARSLSRARILLMADRNQSDYATQEQIARALDCSKDRVSQVCRRFVTNGLNDALYEKPRTGAPPRITGDIEAKLVLLACSEPPEGRKRWTLRLLAEQMVVLGYVDQISNVTVYDRLKKMK